MVDSQCRLGYVSTLQPTDGGIFPLPSLCKICHVFPIIKKLGTVTLFPLISGGPQISAAPFYY